jgi:murein DD-endopeptidase MepM/ murein hydrolase activator NlpD
VTRRGPLAALFTLVLLAASITPAAADTASDLAAAQARAQVIDSVRAQLGTQLATELETEDTVARALRDNLNQQTVLQSDIAGEDTKIASLEDQIAQLDLQVQVTSARIVTEKEQIGSLARAIYAQPSSLLLLLVESRSLGDMVTRVNEYRSAGGRAQALKDHLKDDLGVIDSDLAQQQKARDAEVKLRDQKTANLATLQDLQAKQQKAQTDLANQIAATRYEMSRLDGQSAALAQQIADILQQQEEDIIAAAESAVWSMVQTLEPTSLTFTASAGHSTKYRFIWPIPTATLTQPFGPSSFWFEPPYGGYAHFHTGIDISAAAGTPVLAADDGVVVLAGASIVNGALVGYGNYVVIAHSNGLTTLYGHLLGVAVKAGDRISQGQLVGAEGSTGNSTGAHLHFELRQDNAPIDPAPFLPPGAPSDYHV